jgi:transaldolase/transaldolase/glucose-6-phosphate isomerase
MEEERLRELAQIGQAIWLDFINRSIINSGELKSLVDRGVRGLTSNPAIFEKAIRTGGEYDEDLLRLAREEKSPQEIFEHMAFADIQRAADILFPVYLDSSGADGFVSFEVSPDLAHDTEGTLEEVRRLAEAIDRENVMIKVPATEAGIPAVEQLIGEGFNINITLMFSLDQYDQVSEAYLRGLEKRLERGERLRSISSVASFFVSRMDVKVDKMLDAMDEPEADEIRGKIGIANAKLAYQRFREMLSTDRWQALAREGAQKQRVLWASTSTKDPVYPDTLYVNSLIGPGTVNTIPMQTFEAFIDHGSVKPRLEQDLAQAKEEIEQLEALGIQLDQVTDELLTEGVEKFQTPYHELLERIEKKRAELEAEIAA